MNLMPNSKIDTSRTFWSAYHCDLVCNQTNENYEKKNSKGIESAIIERDKNFSSNYDRLFNNREVRI
jgi:hypothetical protein